MSQGFAGSGLAVWNTGMTLADGPQLTAFGALRTAESKSRLVTKFLSDKKSGLWDEVSSNASSAWANSEVTATLSSDAGWLVRQTFQRADYEPGKGQRVVVTGILKPESGKEVRYGWAIANTDVGTKHVPYNGAYFKTTLTGDMAVVICANGTETVKTKTADWTDKADGTGDCPVVDWTKAQIFIISLQWLGVGRVQFGVEIGGAAYWLYSFDHINELTYPYMLIPNLPIYFGIHGTTGNTKTATQICAAVESEGGRDDEGRPFGYDAFTNVANAAPVDATVTFGAGTAYTSLAANAALYAVCGIRLRSTKLHGLVTPASVIIFGSAASAFRWCLVRNPTLSSGWAAASTASDAVEFLLPSTTTTTVTIPFTTVPSSRILQSGFIGASAKSTSAETTPLRSYRLGHSIAGTPDVLALCAQRLEAAAQYVAGGFNWFEVE